MSFRAESTAAEVERDLPQRLRSGDESALGEILRAHGGMLWRMLCREFQGVLSPADVEDVISVALYRLWISRQSFDPAKAALATWFCSIARNAARDVLKHGWHKARELEVAAELDLAEGAVDADCDSEPDAGLAAGEDDPRVARLRQVLAELPAVQRRILEADAHAWPEVAASKPLAEELGIDARSIPVYRKRALDAARAGLLRCHVPQRGLET
jgi:RNA polymerase sigma-70 factor (ECF subfamily)